MKRPLAIIGFTALCTMLCLINYGGTLVSLCLIIASAVIIAALSFLKSKQALPCAMIFIGVGLACFLFMCGEYQRQTALSLCGDSVSVEAVVSETAEFSAENGRHYQVVRLKSISGEKAYGKMRMSYSETRDGIDAEELKIGDTVSFTARAYKIGSQNSDIHSYYSSIGIYTGAYNIKNLKKTEPFYRPLTYYASIVRNHIFDSVNRSFDSETASVIIAILTGEKSYCDGDVYSAFKKSGAAHIMAVSGMHLSVWVLFIGYLFEKLGKHRKMSVIIMSVTVFSVMLISCFSPSVQRAGAMVLLHLVGRLIGRKSDGLNSLGFAAIILMLFNPYIAVNIGFQLSFLSVLSIYLFAIPLINFAQDEFIDKIPFTALKNTVYIAASSVFISVGVSIFTFPVTAMAFGGVSVVSPLTNLLLLPVATPFMVLSGAFSAFSSVPFFSTLLRILLKASASYIIGCVKFTSSIPFAYFPINTSHIMLWIFIFSAVIILLFTIMRRHSFIAKLSVLGICVAFTFSMLNQVSDSLFCYRITPFYTEGSYSYIVSMNGRGVLIAADDGYYFGENLDNTAESLAVRLEAAVFSDDFDAYERDYICGKRNISHILHNNSDSISLYKRVEITCNEYSITVEGNGIKTEILMKDYLQNNGECDIIICNYGVFFNGKEDARSEYKLISFDRVGFYIAVNEKGEITFGGSDFG